MDKIFTRKIRVSAEDMARINESMEKYKQKGVPEDELKRYFTGLVEIHGIKIGPAEEEEPCTKQPL